ncbi:TonB-dependent receptor [Sphingomonas sp. AR_OL41]|uniref:TonB-dependent receptor n=1 Tax=Sphingomonas sp. AR_OL41 TaxID=3042729 RepID=UPI0024819167|nr:TonB-dependent receptor [Sphingomonas sp. AR_OL41]MDH7972113.1 TonB-dependent receptor [Sphingomonas sp. AR_OL41]
MQQAPDIRIGINPVTGALNKWPLLCGAMLLGFSPFCAQAQSTPDSDVTRQGLVAKQDATPASTNDGIGDIVVTARKRSENLQSTPIAITAVNAADLAARGSVDLATVNDIAPNVVFKTGGATSGATFTPVINIRGIGQSDFTINTDPGVGVYLDGVYLGRSVGSVLDLADVERIEVLRGPQGTLFGRNTIGGAVSVISKAPSTDKFSGNVDLSGGSRAFYSVQASLNVPIASNLALRVSGMYRHRDGYVDALQYRDYKLGGERMWAGRAALRYQPFHNLTIDLSVDHTERRDPPAAIVGLQLGSVSTTSTAPTGSDSTFFNSGAGPVATAKIPYISVDAPRCASDATFRNNSLTCYGNTWLAGTTGNNSVWYDKSGQKIIPTNVLNVTGFGATVALQSAIGTFKSITSYRKFDTIFYSDLDLTPYVIFQNNNVPYRQNQLSQEFQLVGDAFHGRLNYVVGLYYFREKGDEAVDLLTPGDIPAALAPALAPTLPYFQTTSRFINNTSKAAYAQATLAVTDRLKITGGLRYTDDFKDYNVSQLRAVGAALNGSGTQQSKIWTPMANIAWQATDNLLIYGTYSEGYRAGGFAARFPGGLPTPLPSFNPEYVTSYEAGVKSTLFNRHLILNLAAFRINYRDIQVTATVANLPGFTLNLANAHFTGFEGEARAILGSGFAASVSVGYTNKTLTEVAPGTQSSAGTNAVVNITTASRLPGPAWQLNGQLTKKFELANGGRVDSEFDVHYESSDSNSVANYAIIEQPGFAVANARISYSFPRSGWSAAVGARNLFDATYFTTKVLSSASGSAYGTVARPREAYLQIGFRF